MTDSFICTNKHYIFGCFGLDSFICNDKGADLFSFPLIGMPLSEELVGILLRREITIMTIKPACRVGGRLCFALAPDGFVVEMIGNLDCPTS